MSGSAFIFTQSLGAFAIEATLEETHTTTLGITKYPVEKGSEISDHAQIQPKTFDIVGGVASLSSGGWNPSKVADAHNQLVQVQESREPLSVMTGLGLLPNMLIQSITCHRDKETASVYFFRAHLVEVVIVGTQIIANQFRPVTPDGSPPTLSQQETSNRASPVVDRGQAFSQDRWVREQDYVSSVEEGSDVTVITPVFSSGTVFDEANGGQPLSGTQAKTILDQLISDGGI